MKKNGRLYVNSDKRNSRKEINKRNEIIVNRLMVLFVLAAAMITYLFYVMNASNMEFITNIRRANLILGIIFSVLTICSLIYFIILRIRKVDEEFHTFNSAGLLVGCAVLTIFSFIIYIKGQYLIPHMLAVTVTFILLVLVFYIYQRLFFYFSIFAALGCFTVYFTNSPFIGGIFATASKILLFALAAALIILSARLASGKGKIKNKLIIKDTNGFKTFLPAVILGGLFAVLGILAFIVPGYFFYYIISIIALFLAMGVYYTIKLI